MSGGQNSVSQMIPELGDNALLTEKRTFMTPDAA